MEYLNDLTLLPWPMFLLIIVIIAISFLYFNVHVPMAEDLDTLKENNETVFKNINEIVNSSSIILLEIKTTMNNLNNIILEVNNEMINMEKKQNEIVVSILDIIKTDASNIAIIKTQLENIHKDLNGVGDKWSSQIKNLENQHVSIKENDTILLDTLIKTMKSVDIKLNDTHEKLLILITSTTNSTKNELQVNDQYFSKLTLKQPEKKSTKRTSKSQQEDNDINDTSS